MDLNLVTNVENCYVDIPSILYYSHIPTVAVALLIGLIVVIKDNRSLVSKILFFLSVLFLFWSVMDMILWITHDSRISMFFWAIINLCEMLVSATTLYFAYVFIEKKDVPLKFKLSVVALLSIFIVLIPTQFNLLGFKGDVCEGNQGPLIYYYYFLEAFFSLWLFVFLISRIKKYWNTKERKKVIYFSIGIVAFLFSFSGTNILGSALTAFNINILGSSNDNWKILQYGLFGMPVFLGFLSYLIVKYKAFNIKMLGAQALVVALVALIFSEFFFIGIENVTVTVLISVTVLLSVIFGIWLVNSVKNEVQRKEELQNMSDRLASANDQLQKLDNAKSDFISIASHQLRTPLTAIKGFVSLLLEGSYGKMDPKQDNVLNKVYSSNERLLHLVEDLLDISRMESGRMQFKFEKWKLENIVQEVVDTFFIKAKDKSLYLQYDKPEKELPELMIDGIKVREVISNLVDNALKYSIKGGVTVRVTEEKNNNLRVTISDTGIGIPKTELSYLFAKFSRGKDIGRLNTGGTGLGLYVGKSMVEANGGKIWAESDGEGQGSRFIIELPIKQSEDILKKWG